MAGAYYIWIMGALFVGCGGVMLLIIGLLLIGHWLEKKQTGAKHGFLELPEELRGKPAEKQSDEFNGGADETSEKK